MKSDDISTNKQNITKYVHLTNTALIGRQPHTWPWVGMVAELPAVAHAYRIYGGVMFYVFRPNIFPRNSAKETLEKS